MGGFPFDALLPGAFCALVGEVAEVYVVLVVLLHIFDGRGFVVRRRWCLEGAGCEGRGIRELAALAAVVEL